MASMVAKTTKRSPRASKTGIVSQIGEMTHSHPHGNSPIAFRSVRSAVNHHAAPIPKMYLKTTGRRRRD